MRTDWRTSLGRNSEMRRAPSSYLSLMRDCSNLGAKRCLKANTSSISHLNCQDLHQAPSNLSRRKVSNTQSRTRSTSTLMIRSRWWSSPQRSEFLAWSNESHLLVWVQAENINRLRKYTSRILWLQRNLTIQMQKWQQTYMSSNKTKLSSSKRRQTWKPSPTKIHRPSQASRSVATRAFCVRALFRSKLKCSGQSTCPTSR